MNVNTKSQYFLMQAVVPIMRRRAADESSTSRRLQDELAPRSTPASIARPRVRGNDDQIDRAVRSRPTAFS